MGKIAADTADTEVIILNYESNGIEQITKVLAQQENLNSIHVISHGDPGTLYLGNTALNNNNLGNYASKIREWQKALANKANLFLYGCSVAAGTNGKTFVKQISELLSVNVAASKTLTGDQKLGGNWDLEFTIGKFTSELLFNEKNCSSYGHVLTAPDPEDVGENDMVGQDCVNDLLIANNLTNTIWGLGGDDELIGFSSSRYGSVPQSSTNSAGIQQDVYVGGAGADTFVIGQSGDIFYTLNFALDYALITDLSVAEGDKVQLAGSATDYDVQVVTDPNSGLSNTQIYYKKEIRDNDGNLIDTLNDLVAEIQGVAFTDLSNTNVFTFDNTQQSVTPAQSISVTKIHDGVASTVDELTGGSSAALSDPNGGFFLKHDVLVGGSGAGNGREDFVLGDTEGAFYAEAGFWDYALIMNYTPNEDFIRLTGDASDYNILGAAGSGFSAIYLADPNNSSNPGELIAYVMGAEANDLTIDYIQVL